MAPYSEFSISHPYMDDLEERSVLPPRKNMFHLYAASTSREGPSRANTRNTEGSSTSLDRHNALDSNKLLSYSRQQRLDMTMHSVAAAQAAIQNSLTNSNSHASRSSAAVSASIPAPVASAPNVDQDPHLILKALQASMSHSPQHPRLSDTANLKPSSKAVTAAVDVDGFDWTQLSPAASGPYSSDPAMRALARESEALDDVYDPTEDPDNLGPGSSKKAPTGSYWTQDTGTDAWWEHGGEDGMT